MCARNGKAAALQHRLLDEQLVPLLKDADLHLLACRRGASCRKLVLLLILLPRQRLQAAALLHGHLALLLSGAGLHFFAGGNPRPGPK